MGVFSRLLQNDLTDPQSAPRVVQRAAEYTVRSVTPAVRSPWQTHPGATRPIEILPSVLPPRSAWRTS